MYFWEISEISRTPVCQNTSDLLAFILLQTVLQLKYPKITEQWESGF